MKQKLLLCTITLLCFIMFNSILVAYTDFPTTPAGQRAKEVLRLINKESPLTPKDYVRQNCSENFKSRVPENLWGSAITQIRDMSGQMNLVSIIKSELYEIE